MDLTVFYALFAEYAARYIIRQRLQCYHAFAYRISQNIAYRISRAVYYLTAMRKKVLQKPYRIVQLALFYAAKRFVHFFPA